MYDILTSITLSFAFNLYKIFRALKTSEKLSARGIIKLYLIQKIKVKRFCLMSNICNIEKSKMEYN